MLFKDRLFYGKLFAPDGDVGTGGASGNGNDDVDEGEGTVEDTVDGDDGGNTGENAGDGDDGEGDVDEGDEPDVAALEASVAKLTDTLKKERAAHKAAKREVTRLEGELRDALAKSDNSELEGKIADLERKLRDATSKNAITEAATAANAISPKAVYALIRDKVEIDDEGNATNVAELVEALRNDEPTLFRAAGGSLDGGARSGSTRVEPKNPTERMAGAYAKNKK